ncbi:MAG: haloacid dehalogenase type II [Actinobacteria bacterium]|nr:haloacid dehalogenase type II [Actinomycetota bacterium]
MTAQTSLDALEALTFDLYGTVVDMQTGLTEAIGPFLEEKGYGGPPERVVTWWRRTHFESSMIDALIDRGHTPYREIGRRALSHTLDRAGVPYTRSEVEDLVAEIERLRPFPDVVDALRTLKHQYRIFVLSNGDPDMLENAKPYLGVEFDRMISVAETGYYKPHFATYRAAAEQLGIQAGSFMHVANHPFDCLGAKASGMRAAYVNRRGRPFGETPFVPDLEVRDFAELAAALIG